jgi:hypothetical protein
MASIFFMLFPQCRSIIQLHLRLAELSHTRLAPVMPAGQTAGRKLTKCSIYNGLPGKFKIRRDWAGPQFLFSFAQGIKFSPAFGAGDVLPDCCYGLKGGCCE